MGRGAGRGQRGEWGEEQGGVEPGGMVKEQGGVGKEHGGWGGGAGRDGGGTQRGGGGAGEVGEEYEGRQIP